MCPNKISYHGACLVHKQRITASRRSCNLVHLHCCVQCTLCRINILQHLWTVQCQNELSPLFSIDSLKLIQVSNDGKNVPSGTVTNLKHINPKSIEKQSVQQAVSILIDLRKMPYGKQHGKSAWLEIEDYIGLVINAGKIINKVN